MSATPEAAPVIVRVVYPVSVDLPDGPVPFAKLVVTTGAAYVYVAAPTSPGGSGVHLQWSADLTGPPTLTNEWDGRGHKNILPTAQGDIVATNLGGCGCHASALRYYRPFSEQGGPERLGT